jgi:hypothetical protein
MAEGMIIHTNTIRPSHNPIPEDMNRVMPETSMDEQRMPMEHMTPIMDTSEG